MASAGRREGPPGRGRRLRPSTGPSPAAAARIEVDDQPRPVIAALAAEPSCITGALRARDTALMAAALAAMGVDVREEGHWDVGGDAERQPPKPQHQARPRVGPT
jgi:hypothetical protein